MEGLSEKPPKAKVTYGFRTWGSSTRNFKGVCLGHKLPSVEGQLFSGRYLYSRLPIMGRVFPRWQVGCRDVCVTTHASGS